MQPTVYWVDSFTDQTCFQDRTEEQGRSLVQLDIYLDCFRLI